MDTKIRSFINGEIPEDKFKLFRLTRGVYGQRQLGVQMFRIKLPAGRIAKAVSENKLELSEQYASSNLHFTTRPRIFSYTM